MNKLTPEQRKQFNHLRNQARRRGQEARKVAKGGTAKPVGKKGKPAATTGKPTVNKNTLAKDLDALAKNDPKLKATADKLKANKPLTKTDLANLNKAMKNAKDPKTKAALRNAFVAKYGLSDNALTQIIANDKSPPLTPNEKTAVDKYLHGQPLTAADKAVLDNLQDRPPASLAGLKAAFAQMNRDIRDQDQAQALANALANAGGGGGTVLPGGGLLPSGPDGVTPMAPTAWFPNPGSPAVGPDDVTPVGTGVACTVTPNATGGIDGGPDGGEVAGGATDLGSVATQATALQKTRFLRLANGTANPLTISLQYYTENDKGDWEWSPGEPGGDGALTFNLEPGETVDAKDNDWRINASRVRIWAKSEDGKWMEFKDKDLLLVPETTSDGEHGYQANDVQVFNWTVR